MKITIIDTISQYEKLFSLENGRETYYRDTMMRPFQEMWQTINVPIKAKQPNGYDAVMATQMLGYLDVANTEVCMQAFKKLKEIHALQTV